MSTQILVNTTQRIINVKYLTEAGLRGSVMLTPGKNTINDFDAKQIKNNAKKNRVLEALFSANGRTGAYLIFDEKLGEQILAEDLEKADPQQTGGKVAEARKAAVQRHANEPKKARATQKDAPEAAQKLADDAKANKAVAEASK